MFAKYRASAAQGALNNQPYYMCIGHLAAQVPNAHMVQLFIQCMVQEAQGPILSLGV